MFEIEFTDEFGAWWQQLTDREQQAISVRVELLEQRGPALRRPAVGEIKGSAFDPQMKELVVEGNIRVLFIFDPRRTAILLVGGDKSGLWNAWYRTAIPAADELYRTYLNETKEP